MAIIKRKTAEQKTQKPPQELITATEFAYRKRVWGEYYAKARQSQSYQRFLEQQVALKRGDIATVRRIAAEAREDLLNGRFLPKPPFPDPDLERVYGRLGIKEVWERQLEIATKEVQSNEAESSQKNLWN